MNQINNVSIIKKDRSMLKPNKSFKKDAGKKGTNNKPKQNKSDLHLKRTIISKTKITPDNINPINKDFFNSFLVSIYISDLDVFYRLKN